MPAGLWWQCGQQLIECIAPTNILRLRRLCPSIGSLSKRIQLFGFQLAQVARLLIQHERAIAYAADLLDEVADLFKHLSQLAIATFDQHHLIPRIVPLPHLTNTRG
jgi:hypothetical protein